MWERGAALPSRLHWFETEVPGQDENLKGLSRINRELSGEGWDHGYTPAGGVGYVELKGLVLLLTHWVCTSRTSSPYSNPTPMNTDEGARTPKGSLVGFKLEM